MPQGTAPAAEPPPPSTGDGQGEISLDDWTRDDWKLVQPHLSLIELDGYLRLRGDMLRKLDFGNATATEFDSSGQPVRRYPLSDDGEANFNSTNMRLRLEPTLNVSESIHIVTTIDVLDNLVMGSTPFAITTEGGQPISILSTSQETARGGTNAVFDNIAIKRAYARLTALNEQLELRFGRMPSDWGLGMLSNSGDCLDCDFGDIVDRIALTFKAADHLFTPMYDWVSNGPVLQPFGRAGGQPIDAVSWDDADQYSLQIQRLDGDADIRDRVMQGETVVNYGLWTIWRRQKRDLTEDSYNNNVSNNVTTATAGDAFAKDGRNANVFTGDGYLRLYRGRIKLNFEGAVIYGTLDLPTTSAAADTTGTEGVTTALRDNDLWRWAGAVEAAWQGRGDYKNLTLGLKAGAASGDRRKGFGVLDLAGTQRGAGDTSLNNFQFSPDYHIDLLLFRRIIGTVTDAWYVRPELAYVFDNGIGGRFSTVYSQAIYKSTTQGNALPLGLEVDGELSYGIIANPESGSLKGALAGGLLFPFGGFKNPDQGENGESGSLAWTLQARLYLTF